MEEIERLMGTLVQIAGSSEFCTEDERWRLAEKRIMKIATTVGPKAVMGFLLGVLRRANMPEEVVDVVAKTMALCSGPCAAPPRLRFFIFSPSLTIHINEMDYIQGGLGWKVWGAALILSWRLLALKDMVRGKNVLELGSGCGLCGLLLAHLGTAKVVLTDNVTDILLNLRKNISRLTINDHSELKPYRQVSQEKFLSNKEQFMVGLEHPQGNHFLDYLYEKSAAEECTCSCLISVRKLDWLEDAAIASHDSFSEIQAPDKFPGVAVNEKFDWIVGSDLLYDKKCSLALAQVIQHRLSTFDGKALLVTPVREKEILEQFLKELDQLGMLTKVEEVDQQEWNNCKLASCTLDGDDSLDEDGTMYDMEHYEGGIVALYITRKTNS
ncbi:protein-lysine N-methyltransferase EFM2 isoform X1 [Cryptomeria japonica]|uniref:protein-lysine N-methyltransferase EFM2 isoform X1 n=1 Tax=Cryptomeria japonica TaxID=3369 RepID=UPI0027D9DEDB|nr:protein-lysine N-methyltransferase EFM2 isoform X1 [Cryptomeria japonica]XP_057867876.2 protein-lysine N-methyltransferase EFM2 isoform X1 [Cryptomeria japonica]XP_057867877.2 protein-lysine N-methyltransferase EFM2 isoform X1 [Cryptomeria japonica]XP_057867878.2 protein-lysine N-methyltransferase EFM2 isoform X1 [Cryptomeria japonica]